MATFLSLVNDVERESGTVSQSQWLATVTGATGRQRKIVDWVRQAWEMIQRERNDWIFRRAQFSHALEADEKVYTPTDLGLTDFGGWMPDTVTWQGFTVYDGDLGVADECSLRVVSYREWLTMFDRGSQQSQRPTTLAFTWGRDLAIGAAPDKAYVLRGWYRKAVQSLAVDADEPIMPEDYHQAIVWRALMLLGDDDEAAFEVASSTNSYRQAFSAMLADLLDPIEA